MNFNGLKHMPKQFWVLIAGVFFINYNIASYYDNLNDAIVKRFQIPYVNAGYLMFIPYGIAALFSFILGKILEKNPKLRRKSILYGTILYGIGLLTLYMVPNL